MVRFVEMNGIYLDDKKSFGFYDTVKDSFISFNGSYVFDDVQEFKDTYMISCGYEYDRLTCLITKEWKDQLLNATN